MPKIPLISEAKPYNRPHTGSGSVVCKADRSTRAGCFWRLDFELEPVCGRL